MILEIVLFSMLLLLLLLMVAVLTWNLGALIASCAYLIFSERCQDIYLFASRFSLKY